MNKYNYQPQAAQKVLDMALSGKYIAAVLAACPSAGKSTIIIYALNEFFKKHPNKRVVISTHNQNILKTQMLETFSEPHVKPEFTFGEFGSGAMVEVGIPSNASKITSMDMLVVDEAHQYFWEKLMDKIVAKHQPEYTILLTGSPSYFVKYNKAAGTRHKNFGIHFISAEELMGKEIFSGLDIDIVKSDMLSLEWTIEDTFAHAEREGCDLRKVMWACKDIEQAKAVKYYLTTKYGLKVYLSTSDNDADSLEIKKFKAASTGVLLVVNKGILGFSDGTITTLIDYKMSKDLETRYQLIARVLRKHPEGVRKNYLSVSCDDNYKKEYVTLSQTISLFDKDVFMNYTGKAPAKSLRAA